ncbi:MAG TPA: hypothetical protein VEL75_20760 [Candidatus Methylomirabilis sp.]|nr:hypothetical protein [Candidatus Methylomirabilis sp.]
MLLLGGWLLILPPIKGDEVNTKAPLSNWERPESYATASDCIADRGRRWVDARKRRGEDDLLTFQYLEGRCVAAESISPPNSPAPK